MLFHLFSYMFDYDSYTLLDDEILMFWVEYNRICAVLVALVMLQFSPYVWLWFMYFAVTMMNFVKLWAESNRICEVFVAVVMNHDIVFFLCLITIHRLYSMMNFVMFWVESTRICVVLAATESWYSILHMFDLYTLL